MTAPRRRLNGGNLCTPQEWGKKQGLFFLPRASDEAGGPAVGPENAYCFSGENRDYVGTRS